MKVKVEIKSWLTGHILFTAEVERGISPAYELGEAVKAAVQAGANLESANLESANLESANLYGANLRSANLESANLYGANLYGANLESANLRSANLRSANLESANLRSANLESANLESANLESANLRSANLESANLESANLESANLRSANLYGANLESANLESANLRSANLYGANLESANLESANLESANLYGANLSPLQAAVLSIVPEVGDYIAWKKCEGPVIVKLRIPADAKRSNATGRKCRAEYAEVLEVLGGIEGVSMHDNNVVYRVGETVRCHYWEENRWEECAGGIHHFITRVEAENYC